MQNRYTGDIGDFGKLGLLRQLSLTRLHIGVNWYLVPDEAHNNDGRHIGYLKKDSFCSCDESLRRQLGKIVDSGLRGCEVVFVDPDNGLMVPSAAGTPKSNKFVLPGELAEYYRSGASVIYYQHKARRPDNFYRTQHEELLVSGAFPASTGAGVKFISTSQRYYFFIIQPQHKVQIESALSNMLKTDWARYFKPC